MSKNFPSSELNVIHRLNRLEPLLSVFLAIQKKNFVVHFPQKKKIFRDISGLNITIDNLTRKKKNRHYIRYEN